MTEPRIVSPEEAQGIAQQYGAMYRPEPWEKRMADLAHTVATEPDRTRAAVVKVLRKWRDRQMHPDHVLRMNGRWIEVDLGELDADIDAIENGADY